MIHYSIILTGNTNNSIIDAIVFRYFPGDQYTLENFIYAITEESIKETTNPIESKFIFYYVFTLSWQVTYLDVNYRSPLSNFHVNLYSNPHHHFETKIKITYYQSIN